MSEINYIYRHESFNLNLAYHYTLVLQINNTDFTLAIIYHDKLLALSASQPISELAHPGAVTDVVFADYKNIVVGIEPDGFTLIPFELYNTERIADIARYLDVTEDRKVLAQQLDDDNFVIYKVRSNIISAVEKLDLQHCVFAARGWINIIGASEPSNSNLYLNIEANVVEILAFKNQKIALYNTFEYHTPDDLVYFTALAANNLNIPQRDSKLILSGAEGINAEIKDRLSAYFPVVEQNTLMAVELPQALNNGIALKLTALQLCVSSVVV